MAGFADAWRDLKEALAKERNAQRKGDKVRCDEKCKEAFDRLRKNLLSSPVDDDDRNAWAEIEKLE